MFGLVLMEEVPKKELDISSFEDGIYMITLHGGTKSYTQKIIKL